MSKTKEQTWRTKRIREMLSERGIPSVAESPNWPEPERVPVLSITIIAGRTVHDQAAANFDMDSAQARWAAWDAVLARMLEPGDLPAPEPILSND